MRTASIFDYNVTLVYSLSTVSDVLHSFKQDYTAIWRSMLEQSELDAFYQMVYDDVRNTTTTNRTDVLNYFSGMADMAKLNLLSIFNHTCLCTTNTKKLHKPSSQVISWQHMFQWWIGKMSFGWKYN